MASGPDTRRVSRVVDVLGWIRLRSDFLGSVLSLVLVQVAVAGLGFVTRVKIAQVLGKEAFGELAFALAIGTYALMFVQFGFEKSLVRELVHFPSRFGELLHASLVIRLVLFVLLICVSAAVLCFGPTLFDETWAGVAIVFATLLMAFQLQAVYDAKRQSRRHAAFFFAERALYFALIWAVVWIPNWTLSLSHVGTFMILSVAFGLVLQYRWALPRIEFQGSEGLFPSVAYMCRSNVWLWLAVLAGLSIEYMTQIVLKCYAGSESLGGYSAAWLIIRLALIVLTQFSRLGAERMAQYTRPGSDAARRGRFILKYSASMAAIGLLVGLPCILIPRMLLFPFGSEYSEATEILRTLGFYPALFGPYLVLLQYTISSRLQRTYFALISIVGTMSVVLSVALVSVLQGEGAALAVVLSLAVGLILFGIATAIHVRKAS